MSTLADDDSWLHADRIADAMLQCSLPKPQWTHEAHVLSCISLVRKHGPRSALGLLREAIPRYNLATGVANTSTTGYHDTLTVFYVWSIDRLLQSGLSTAEIIEHPEAGRAAAFQWWDRDTLLSPDARLGFVRPSNQLAAEAVPSEVFPSPPATRPSESSTVQ